MNYTQYVLEKVDFLNPVHAKKLRKNLASFDEHYQELANQFYEKYNAFLQQDNKTFDYAIDSYLGMVADMNIETVDFYRTGRYSSSTFDEVNQRVYANPEVMEYYMHGLILSQFLWKHHYLLFRFFIDNLSEYSAVTNRYLEIGAGHGLYLSKALELLDSKTVFSVVDVSQTSIDVAKKFTDNSKVSFHRKDIFEFSDEHQFDFITMGEVLEHVEDPLLLLRKLFNLLSDKGTLFLSTPTNAPTIDHIHLFNSVDEIRDMIHSAGFEIVSENAFMAEDVSEEKAKKYKITTLYGTFLKKNLR